MDFITIYIEILALFVVMFVGWILGRVGVVTRQGENVISEITMKAGLPALILTSMSQNFTIELFTNSLGLIVISVGVYGVIIVGLEIWNKLSKKSQEELGTLQVLVLYGNVAFIGFPVANALYGSVGVFYAASFNILWNLLQFSYAVLLLNRDSKINIYKMIMNPGFIATILGFLLLLLKVKLPYLFLQPLTMIGDITIPLALLIVGSSLSRIKVTDIVNQKSVWFTSLTRLLIFPALLLISLNRMGLNEYLIAIPVVIMATPVGFTCGAFAFVYGGDIALANKGVVLSNLLSVITLPLVIWVLMQVI